jgi:hypothetical protein
MVGLRQRFRNLLSALHASEELLGPSERRRIADLDAEKRAAHLLIGNLSAPQRDQFEMFGHFDVVGSDTGKRYRICRGQQLNVVELDRSGRHVRILCFMPQGGVPLGDVMLAQKLSLELFEADVLKVANRSPAWEDVFSGLQQVGCRYHRRMRI